MGYPLGASAVVLGFAFFCPLLAFSAEPVGEATLIKTEVTGETGPLVLRGPVHRNERIRTSPSGLGQFLFRDGTKLAVGAGSSVVIDKFVYDDSNSVKRLSIKAAKGTFRWISGNSASSAYSIVTPAGTIGVRGTAFDFYVGPNGTTAVVLLNGAAQFCGPGGCRQLKQQCDCVIATPGGNMSDPAHVDRNALRRLGNPRALGFLTGSQQLSGALGGIRTSCGLASVREDRQDRPAQPQPRQQQQQPGQAPPPDPQKPDKPDRPDKPDKPDRPDKPDHHHDGDHDDGEHHDKDHHDRDHDDGDGHDDDHGWNDRHDGHDGWHGDQRPSKHEHNDND